MLSLCLRSVFPSFVQNPTNTVFDAKRLIGRNFSDKTVQDDMKLWPFKVINENGKPIIEVEYQVSQTTAPTHLISPPRGHCVPFVVLGR